MRQSCVHTDWPTDRMTGSPTKLTHQSTKQITTTVNNTTFILYTIVYICQGGGTAVAQWLRCCATNRKVAASIPDGIIGIFH